MYNFTCLFKYKSVSHMKTTVNCMLQAEPPSLHYYCAVVLHSCIVLPPVGHSSNHQCHCCELTDNRAVLRIFSALFKFSFDCPSYIMCNKNTPIVTVKINTFDPGYNDIGLCDTPPIASHILRYP